MMAWAKRIYILMVKVNKFIFFFTSRYFLKEIENMFFMFLHESLGELEKAVETLACGSCSHVAFLKLIQCKQKSWQIISFQREAKSSKWTILFGASWLTNNSYLRRKMFIDLWNKTLIWNHLQPERKKNNVSMASYYSLWRQRQYTILSWESSMEKFTA